MRVVDHASLDRIRRKVESGERLTERELERLRDAARAQPGPTLRLGADRLADLSPPLIHEAQALGHDMGANAA
jgi:hypothetical protein